MDGRQLGVEMPDQPPAAETHSEAPSAAARVRLAGAGIGLVAVAVVLWGGYARRWPWTGINGSTATLWDWLHLLLLPVAFGLLPILLSRGKRMRPEHRRAGVLALTGFAALVVAGYAVPWSWTGFTGNKLWDWLELLALPLAVTLVPVMDEIRDSWSPRHSLLAAAGLCAFVAIVIGGYLGDWTWTGFRGNTLWNWLQLLLLPLLLPTVVVPRLKPKMEAALIVVEEPAADRTADGPAAGQKPRAGAAVAGPGAAGPAAGQGPDRSAVPEPDAEPGADGRSGVSAE